MITGISSHGADHSLRGFAGWQGERGARTASTWDGRCREISLALLDSGQESWLSALMEGFKRIERSRISDEVAGQIRAMLAAKRLVPGDRLASERDLAKTMGVSRGVVREALRVLEDHGVVNRKAGKAGGSFIAEGDPAVISGRVADLFRLGGVSLEQLTEARLMIEEGVAQLACMRATDAELDGLERLIDSAETLYTRGMLIEKTELNIDFFDQLAELTHNPVLSIVMRGITGVLRQLAVLAGPEPGVSTFAARRHLLAALRARDKHMVLEAVRDNLRRAEKTYADALRAREVPSPALASPGPKRPTEPKLRRNTAKPKTDA